MILIQILRLFSSVIDNNCLEYGFVSDLLDHFSFALIGEVTAQLIELEIKNVRRRAKWKEAYQAKQFGIH